MIPTNKKQTKKRLSVSKHYIVHSKDLPLSCPTSDKEAWNMHPRVYLPIEESGEVVCPYCSAKYILESSTK